MVTDIEFLKEKLKKEVNEQRYLHCLAVMEMSKKLAEKYGADIKRAELIGLMHDLAKDMTQKLDYALENNIPCSETEKANIEIMHGKIAADICKKKYGFDEEMCTAIAVHTTGKEDMTLLEKILFVADKIDETRKYPSAEELRKMAFEDLDKTIIANIDATIEKCISNNKAIVEDTIKTRNYLLINSEK